MAEIIFDKVGKSYGAVPVIRDFDLTIKDQEFVVLVGPSGCGKSTALRMIAGLEDVTSGELRIDERRVNEVEPRDRDVAIVLQSYALYPHKTVRQNIEFALKIRHVPKPEIDRLVAEAAGMLGLTPFLDRKPRALSGGQRQRVALGRAIVRRPKAFLFDEPLSNLDAELRVTTRAEIVNLRRRFSTTTVYVTHDQTEAMTMGDRIAVLAPLGDDSKTNLMQYGTPMELYRRPQNVFVAQFIGSPKMNVYEMAVDGAGGRLVIGEQSLAIPPSMHRSLSERHETRVLVGVRPEHLSIEPDTESADGKLSAVVDLVEPLGDEAVVHLSFDGRPIVVKTTGGEEPPRTGDRVRLRPDPTTMHFFDLQSRHRLEGALQG